MGKREVKRISICSLCTQALVEKYPGGDKTAVPWKYGSRSSIMLSFISVTFTGFSLSSAFPMLLASLL